MKESTKNKKRTAILVFQISRVLFFIEQDLLGKHQRFWESTVHAQAIDDECSVFYADFYLVECLV